MFFNISSSIVLNIKPIIFQFFKSNEKLSKLKHNDKQKDEVKIKYNRKLRMVLQFGECADYTDQRCFMFSWRNYIQSYKKITWITMISYDVTFENFCMFFWRLMNICMISLRGWYNLRMIQMLLFGICASQHFFMQSSKRFEWKTKNWIEY